MHGNDEAIGSHARNRIESLDRIVERPALEQSLVDVRLRPAEQDGVAVRRSANDRSGGERSAAPTDILDHQRAKERLELVRQRTADEVVGAAGRKRNDQADRARGIALRPRDVRHGRERGGADGETQECTAKYFHARWRHSFAAALFSAARRQQVSWHGGVVEGVPTATDPAPISPRTPSG